jgi:hypothetical protein
MYLVSFVVSMLSGWALNSTENPTLRKPLSLIMGALIQVYMYGKGKGKLT